MTHRHPDPTKDEIAAKRQSIRELAAKNREQVKAWPEWMPRTLGPVPTAPKFPSKDEAELKHVAAGILAEWIESGKVKNDHESILAATPQAVDAAKAAAIRAVEDYLK
jgi:hypothetical protein